MPALDSSRNPQTSAAAPEIGGWRVRLYFLSRNPHVLFWTAVVILVLGVFIGRRMEPGHDADDFDAPSAAMAGGFSADDDDDDDDDGRERVNLNAELKKTRPEFTRVIDALHWQETDDENAATTVLKKLEASRLPQDEILIAAAYWASITSKLDEPGADLLVLAYQAHPLPRTNELAGDLYAASGREALALEHYQKELLVHPDSQGTVRKLVDFYWEKEDFAKLGELQANPAYASGFTPNQTLEIAAKAHDWKGTLGPLWTLQKKAFENKVPVFLTAVAGLLWLILAWQMVQIPGLLSFRTIAPLVAIVLGAASTFPVLFLDIVQRELWDLKHTGMFLNDCVFLIAGVGVREEFCKWLAFLPLFPVLMMRRSRLEVVIFAGCVGLGFAIEENVSYFTMSSNPATAFGRFLTANFFHFAATGLIGVAFYDSVLDWRKKWWKFPFTFVVVALAHGFYDAFIGVPRYVFIAIGLSCFMLLSLAFFREVSRERGPATDQLFPGATLIVGLSLLVATVIVCAARQSGVDFALAAVASSGVFLSLFIYMFFILFRDGLVEDEEIPEVKFNIG